MKRAQTIAQLLTAVIAVNIAFTGGGFASLSWAGMPGNMLTPRPLTFALLMNIPLMLAWLFTLVWLDHQKRRAARLPEQGREM